MAGASVCCLASANTSEVEADIPWELQQIRMPVTFSRNPMRAGLTPHLPATSSFEVRRVCASCMTSKGTSAAAPTQ